MSSISEMGIHTYIYIHCKPRGFYGTIVVQEITFKQRRFATATPLWRATLYDSPPLPQVVAAQRAACSEMGNPFMDPGGDLLVLDTRVVADCTVVESVQTIEKIWQQRCDSFYRDRLIARSKHLNDTITKAKLQLFHGHVHKDKPRQQNQVNALKVTEPCFPPYTLPIKFDTVTWPIFSHMRINRGI